MKVDLGRTSGTIRDRADRKRPGDLEEAGRRKSGSLDSCCRRAIVFRRESRVQYRGRVNEWDERRGTKDESESE